MPDPLGPALTLLNSVTDDSSPLPCRKQGPDRLHSPRVLIELEHTWWVPEITAEQNFQITIRIIIENSGLLSGSAVGGRMIYRLITD